jgi:hypothetical protein
MHFPPARRCNFFPTLNSWFAEFCPDLFGLRRMLLRLESQIRVATAANQEVEAWN